MKMNLRGVIPFTAIVSVLHFFEDAALILLGRMTDVNIFVLFGGTIIFSFVVAIVAKHPYIHKLFHEDNDK
tara:strand:- start:2961 stop:3173 length:213 start_codon:yes stop_codon:yes gene_type:complete